MGSYNRGVKPFNRKFLILVILFAALLLGSQQASRAQNGGQRYFAETGHWVVGEFLAFYEAGGEAELRYGYPITEEFVDQLTGLKIQYFQKARFEYHADNAGGRRVQRSPLGALVYQPGPAVSGAANVLGCGTSAGSEIPVCYAFLDFYERHGGAGVFGEAISGMEYHDGRIMQYFRYGRLEWHPDNPAGSQVIWGNLGDVYFELRGEQAALLDAPQENQPVQTVLQLRAEAFLERATLPREGSQTLYVTVHDQNMLAVQDAQVNYEVRLPNGETQAYLMPPTNAYGVTSQGFTYGSVGLGVVTVKVTVRYFTLEVGTVAAFRLWW